MGPGDDKQSSTPLPASMYIVCHFCHMINAQIPKSKCITSNSTAGDNILKDGSPGCLQLINALIFIFKEGLKFNNGA